MTAEDNMALVRQWVEQVWNVGNLDLLSHFHPPTFDNHGSLSTIEEAKQWHSHNRTTFPDIHYTVNDMFATEDRVAMRWTAVATHSGSLWGMIPPTNKRLTWNGLHLLRIVNDQIVEVWAIADTIAQLQQMGVTLQPSANLD